MIGSTISNKSEAADNTNDANQQIAKWTRVVAFWTRGLVGVGVTTAAVFALQTCILRNQLGEMHVASQAEVAHLRARINIVDYGIRITPPQNVYVGPVFGNTGETEAKSFNIWFNPVDILFSDEKRRAQTSQVVPFSFPREGTMIDKGERREIGQRLTMVARPIEDGLLVAVGYLEYRDIFSESLYHLWWCKSFSVRKTGSTYLISGPMLYQNGCDRSD